MHWRPANNFLGAFSIFESGGITRHLMAGPSGNSEFYFPSTSMFPLALPWNIVGLRETKLTVSLVASHLVLIKARKPRKPNK